MNMVREDTAHTVVRMMSKKGEVLYTTKLKG